MLADLVPLFEEVSGGADPGEAGEVPAGYHAEESTEDEEGGGE